MNPQRTYADTTYNAANPLQRYAHRTRFKRAMELVRFGPHETLLDFGCGDGKFVQELAQATSRDDCVFGFEPHMPSLGGAVRDRIFTDYSALTSAHGQFDVVTCFEVLEHFNERGQQALLEQLNALVRSSGRVVISVPIEVFFPALVKNLNRKRLHNGPLYSFRNIALSVLGMSSRLKALRVPDGYLSHMGFDHRALEQVIKRLFTIEHKEFSPFRWLGAPFNSQVFYIAKKRHLVSAPSENGRAAAV